MTHTRARSAEDQWWRDAVVYEVYCRSFADSNGDGIGDLEGLRRRLDHLASLGVGVIWLSPVYRSPDDDNGYDISDYQDIDPRYGTLADFDRLLADVHARKMRLIMDLVVNHTSDEHPWFLESRSALDSPKRGWYWWRGPRAGYDASESGAEPTNWGSFFGGPAWELDAATGEYYLHLFSRKQPDLRWEEPAVRQAVYEMMRWWLDRGVDGFRMDVINLISKDPRLPDGHPGPDGLGDAGPFVFGGARVHEFLQEMHREVFAGRAGPLLTVGEMPSVTVDEAILFTDPARAEVDMVFQFEHVALDQEDGNKWRPKKLKLTDLKRTLGHWQAGLAERVGRREVAGQFQRDGTLPEVAEALGVARQGGVQDFANLTTQAAGLVHEVAAMAAEELQRDIQRGPVGFAQTEAVGGGPKERRQVGVVGLVPGVGRLAVLLGGDGMDETGVEARLPSETK